MSRFRELLKQTYEKLDLPQPEKSRILLEMASDLEDAYKHYRERGLGEEEAARRAEERFFVSDEAIAELVTIHESPLQRFLGRLSRQAQTRWERALLAAIILFIGGFAGREILSAELYRQSSRFIWPVLGAAGVALILGIFESYKLYFGARYDVRCIREGPTRILALGGASLLAGLCGYLFELYRSAALGAADGEQALTYLLDWGIRCSAMMMVSILVAMAAALAWFVLMGRVRSIEAAEAAVLIE